MKTAYEIYFTTFADPKDSTKTAKWKSNMKALVIAETVTEATGKLIEKYNDAEIHQLNHLGKHNNFVFIG